LHRCLSFNTDREKIFSTLETLSARRKAAVNRRVCRGEAHALQSIVVKRIGIKGEMSDLSQLLQAPHASLAAKDDFFAINELY
jgi:hypothetical protein